MFKFFKGLLIESTLVLKSFPLLVKIQRKPENYSPQDIHDIINKFCLDSLNYNGQKIIVHGMENIPETGALFVGNHRSMIDGIIFPAVISKPLSMIIAKEPQYENIPIVNKWVKLSKSMYIDRENTREALKTISQASVVIKNGGNVGAFPEGHLTDEKDLLGNFKDGLFKIAIKAKCPIVPIVIEGSEHSYIVDKSVIPKVKKSEIHVYILKPIKTHIGNNSIKTKDLSIETRDIILKKICSHRNIDINTNVDLNNCCQLKTSK